MLMLPLLLAAAGASAPAGAPLPGTYEARVCVTVNRQPPTCGPMQARVDGDGNLTLRFDDIRYLISFEQGALIGITLHGGMLVAEFLSSYRWAGDTLLFGDTPRGLQYEVQLSPAR